ncbi:MAG: hypothetical protein ACK40V_10355 [Anaerolineales bacterium]
MTNLTILSDKTSEVRYKNYAQNIPNSDRVLPENESFDLAAAAITIH